MSLWFDSHYYYLFALFTVEFYVEKEGFLNFLNLTSSYKTSSFLAFLNKSI